MCSVSYAGVGIFADEKDICDMFNCAPHEVGRNLVAAHVKKHGASCELYVVEIKAAKTKYFIGNMRPLDKTFHMAGLDTDVLQNNGLTDVVPSSKFQMFAFSSASTSCRIIFESDGRDIIEVLADVQSNGDVVDTLEISRTDDEKDGRCLYNLIYKNNSDNKYQIYKFTSEESIDFMHEGIVSGGSETVICMLTNTYVYTVSMGMFLRMKKTDILAYDLIEVRRDGTPGTHITFAIQYHMEKLYEENSPLVVRVAKCSGRFRRRRALK